MCKPDLSQLILYRATHCSFSDHDFYSPWHAPWWYEGVLLCKKYLNIELSFSVHKQHHPASKDFWFSVSFFSHTNKKQTNKQTPNKKKCVLMLKKLLWKPLLLPNEDDYLFYVCYYFLKPVSKSLLLRNTFSEIAQLRVSYSTLGITSL